MIIEIDPIIQRYEQLMRSKYEQLIFITVPISSTINTNDFEIINLNLIIAEKYQNTQKNISMRLRNLVEEILNKKSAKIVLIDYFELLFESEINIDPLNLFITISKKQPLVIIWRYKVRKKELYYSEPNHPDFYKMKLSNDIVIINGGK